MKRSTHATALLAFALLVPASGQQAQVPKFTITTVAGNGVAGFSGDGNAAMSASLNEPFGVALDVAGNLYVADFVNQRIRKISSNGIITTVAGNGGQGYSGDGGPAINAMLNRPSRVWVDGAGNVLFTDPGNNRVRKIAINGTISTVAGNGAAAETGDGGPATSAALNYPAGVATDAVGNIYISDGDGNKIRKVDTNGVITTFAGNGVQGFSGDGGIATKASFNNPVGMAFDPNGDLFIADSGNNRIRKITDGIITTVAGTGTAGDSGDGGLATAATLNAPSGPQMDAQGNLYFAEGGGNRIRVLLANGTIATVAGTGSASYGGDGGAATSAELHVPLQVAISPSDSIYVADGFNNRIRLLTPTFPVISTNGVVSAGAFGGFPSICPGTWIEIYGQNLATNTRPWASSDFAGNTAPTSLDGTTVSIGGKLAFIDYINPFQVNALVTSDTPTGPQQLVVQNSLGFTYSYTVIVNPFEPGFLAPPSFIVNGTPYIVALFQDGTYALPSGAVAGVSSHLAKAGDQLTLYGVGFGAVIPASPAGQIVQQLNSLAETFQISLGGVAVTFAYDGLAPNYTGLYQFNIVVPSVPAGNQPLTFKLGGSAGTQTLNIAIGN